MNILNIQHAIQSAMEEINKRETIKSIEDIYGEFGIRGRKVKTDEHHYYIYFTKNPFYSFSYMENGELKRCWGISNTFTQKDMDDEIIVIIVMSDGKMYSYPAKAWVQWAVEHNLPEHKTIMRPEDRKNRSDGYIYYNAPLNIMERFNPTDE